MPDTKYDQLLRDFLEEQARDRADGVTLASIHRAVHRIAADRLEDRQRLDRFGRRLKKAESELARLSEISEGPDWAPDPRDVTGTHDLAVLKSQHNEMREDARWGRRQMLIFVASVVGGLLVLTIAGCTAYAVVGFKSPQTQGGK